MAKTMTPQKVYEKLTREYEQGCKRQKFNTFPEYDIHEGTMQGIARALELLLQCEEVTDG